MVAMSGILLLAAIEYKRRYLLFLQQSVIKTVMTVWLRE